MGRIAGMGLGLLLVLAVGAAAANKEKIEPFQLPDQQGQETALAPSDQNTLIVFYRGDW